MKYIKHFLTFLVVTHLFACQSMDISNPETSSQKPQNISKNSLRTIILDDEELTEYEPGQFMSWKCRDYSNGGKVLVELGRIEFTKEQIDSIKVEDVEKEAQPLITAILEKQLQLGFVLYEGTNKGQYTFYARKGLNHRWDWGPEGKYSFIIKPDGTGLFYDFTTAKDGSKDKADDIYKCTK
jgi:hypothetical protein